MKRLLVHVEGQIEETFVNELLAALEIGLDKMRQECPHFSAWLGRLEALGR